jgi:hypothetical protein
MYMNVKKVAMVTLEGEQLGLSHLVAECNGHLGACGTRSHAWWVALVVLLGT